jgi:hypothetical protein
MEAVFSSEMLVFTFKTTRLGNVEDEIYIANIVHSWYEFIDGADVYVRSINDVIL